MSELKPCPFCGGKATSQRIEGMWTVLCNHFDACPVAPFTRRAHFNEAGAVAWWNRRSDPNA